MISFPPAKINLGLQVLKKRTDGYHDLSTCMVEIPLADILEIIPADSFSFNSSGLHIPGGENLCEKAWRLLHRECYIPTVSMHLHKIIPMGAGLGGGSSDAAHTLLTLDKLFHLDLGEEKLMELAAELGSDCAFFIRGKTQLASGRGELLQPVSIELPRYAVLVNPGIHISTAEAYAAVIPNEHVPQLSGVLQLPVSEWKTMLVNDFERGARDKHPQIGSIISQLYELGACYAAMSGSGSTVFGLFAEKPAMENLSAPFMSLLDLSEHHAVNFGS